MKPEIDVRVNGKSVGALALALLLSLLAGTPVGVRELLVRPASARDLEKIEQRMERLEEKQNEDEKAIVQIRTSLANIEKSLDEVKQLLREKR